MSERTRTRAAPLDLTASDAERQLEGRAERIAAALRPHAELEKVLSGRRWRRGLLKRPEWVPALVAQAEALEEALERVHRRAASEAWPEDTAVLRAARELGKRRERLTELARRRLDVMTVAPGDVSLETALTRLDALVRQPPRWELRPGEVLVFASDTRRRPDRLLAEGRRGGPLSPRVQVMGLISAVLFVLLFMAPQELKPTATVLFVLSALVPVLWPLLRSGQVRLTSERLLWKPVSGEVQEVRLGTIPDGGVHLEESTSGLHVEGDRRLHARSVLDATEVALLVELHRQPPLRGAARAGVRLENVALFEARLGRRQGFCVLGPQGLSFIPAGQGPQALSALTGRPTRLRSFDVDQVLDALRWLPEAEFDACVTRVVEATRGTSWTRADSRYFAGKPVWREIRIEHRGQTLIGRVEWGQQEATARLLREWPQAPRSVLPD